MNECDGIHEVILVIFTKANFSSGRDNELQFNAKSEPRGVGLCVIFCYVDKF